ncbi:hypothetical protein DPEC_G00257360 [Dallia pectoralis]|uniref:Uncharacterized protein n=1 Tax=Dallia pectoralis TaxID=75939 RepID=A0ACC2FQV2_DALPE|nr:hypothetical protein DPEC_G00257360 [Dallia pectoralis]
MSGPTDCSRGDRTPLGAPGLLRLSDSRAFLIGPSCVGPWQLPAKQAAPESRWSRSASHWETPLQRKRRPGPGLVHCVRAGLPSEVLVRCAGNKGAVSDAGAETPKGPRNQKLG